MSGSLSPLGTALGESFSHEDKWRREQFHEAALSRRRRNNERIEANVLRPQRFEHEQQADRRVKSIIKQRLVYLSKLQNRFERDRAMQLAAGV